MTLAKKPTAVFLAVAMFFSFALANFTVSAAGQSDTIVSGTAVTVPDADGGMTFAKNEYYRIDKPFEQSVTTIEAWVKVDSNIADGTRVGEIISNYGIYGETLAFGIYTNGNPRLYISQYKDFSENPNNKITNDIVFDKVDVRTGQWLHIAVVIDQEVNKVHCYVNGELKQSIEQAMDKSINITGFDIEHVIGGDLRHGNACFFKGEVRSVALYSDVRTIDEISVDMTAVEKDDLVAAWDLTTISDNIFEDESGNGYHAKLDQIWIDQKELVDEYDYSMVIVGDTQILNYKYPDKYAEIYDWLLNNVESKKIKYVMGLGDITDKDTDEEWERAVKQMARLDGVVPYSLVRGNHDSSTKMNKYFNTLPYINSFNGRYNANVESTWRKINIDDVNYLIFTLQFGPSDEELKWASKIIEAHPEHNVIITTHAYSAPNGYIMPDGLLSNAGSSVYGGANGSKQIWEKLVSKHKNISMIISGHVTDDGMTVTQVKGDNGNVVSQILCNPQEVDEYEGAAGLVTVLYFSEGGKKIQAECISTVREKYYLTSNQIDLEVHTTEHTHKTTLINAKDATCFKKGYSGDKYCSYCDKIYEKGIETDMIAHTPTVVGAVEATDTEAGYTGDTVCAVEGCQLIIKQGEIIAAGQTAKTNAEPSNNEPDKQHVVNEKNPSENIISKSVSTNPYGTDKGDTAVYVLDVPQSGYLSYENWENHGLGWSTGGTLRNQSNTGFATGAKTQYLHFTTINGENFIEVLDNPEKSGCSQFCISPLVYQYGAKETDSISDIFSDADKFTYFAVRLKFEAPQNSVIRASIGVSDTGDGSYGYFKGKEAYLIDKNTGEQIVLGTVNYEIPNGFDGYLMVPASAVHGSSHSIAAIRRLYFFRHADCSNHYVSVNSEWSDTKLYIGDMFAVEDSLKFRSVNVCQGNHKEYKGNTVKATCIEDGYTPYYCYTCLQEVRREIHSATGHLNTTIDKKAATCYQAGYKTVVCECGEEVSNEILPKIAHTPASNIQGAVGSTCYTKGYTGDIVCSICDAAEIKWAITRGKSLPLLEHAASKLVGVKEATSTENGYTGDKVCEECGEVLQVGKVIAATGTNVEQENKAPETGGGCVIWEIFVALLAGAVIFATSKNKKRRSKTKLNV